MLPYMAQGAASAIEDAVVLARCLDRRASDDISSALAVYAASRKERTDRIQLTNRENSWLRQTTDTDWVYEYDAWHTQLS
jgi:salicylate hydroxylase/6-hydroxynicotinate 3-monooxygenase